MLSRGCWVMMDMHLLFLLSIKPPSQTRQTNQPRQTNQTRQTRQLQQTSLTKPTSLPRVGQTSSTTVATPTPFLTPPMRRVFPMCMEGSMPTLSQSPQHIMLFWDKFSTFISKDTQFWHYYTNGIITLKYKTCV